MVVACEHCGVKLSENSMRFHRQVCGSVQKPQCHHCGRRFDADALVAHETVCGDRSANATATSPRQQSPPAGAAAPRPRAAAGAGRGAAADRGDGKPATEAKASQQARPTPQDQATYRKKLTELREEIYGGASNRRDMSPPSVAPERGTQRNRAPNASTASRDASPDAQGSARRQAPWRATIPAQSNSTASRGANYASDSGYAPTALSDVDEDPRATPSYDGPGSKDGGREASHGLVAGGAQGNNNKAVSELRSRLLDQETRLSRVESLVDRIQRELTVLTREHRDVHDDLRDLARQTVGTAAKQRAPSPERGSLSEVRTDLHNLGRHVDVLRDELDAMRTDAQQHRRQLDEQLAEATATTQDHARWLRELDDAGAALKAQVDERLQQQQQEPSHDADAATRQLRDQLADLGARLDAVARDVSDARGGRADDGAALRRDVKLLGRDMDGVQDELRYLRRRLEATTAGDRRRPPPGEGTPHGRSGGAASGRRGRHEDVRAPIAPDDDDLTTSDHSPARDDAPTVAVVDRPRSSSGSSRRPHTAGARGRGVVHDDPEAIDERRAPTTYVVGHAATDPRAGPRYDDGGYHGPPPRFYEGDDRGSSARGPHGPTPSPAASHRRPMAPPAGSQTDTDTESIAARAVSESTRRDGRYPPSSHVHMPAGYGGSAPSSRASSVSSAYGGGYQHHGQQGWHPGPPPQHRDAHHHHDDRGAPPVTHVSLAPQQHHQRPQQRAHHHFDVRR